MCCCNGEGMCKKCSGMTKALFGVLILINAFVWPQWTGLDGWIAFAAVLMIFAGVAKSFTPQAACCKDACGSMEAPAKKKK